MLTIQTLIDDMKAGCKPKDHWRIGVEHERFAFRKSTGASLSYDGVSGIRQLLETFAAVQGWEIIRENGLPIALKKDGLNLTLEPGGQVEYSGSPLSSLTEIREEMGSFYKALDETVSALDIDFLACGFHPVWKRKDIHWMPKGRYALMRPYMEKTGTLGIDMMLRTCGTQVNLDFSSEEDMVQKFRVALALQPVITALMANSRKKEGQDTGYVCYRSHIWTDTDPDRCGILPFVFDHDMGFARYIEYALDVPMYFIHREGRYIDMTGQSFRDFIAGKLPGYEGVFPTIEDWNDHLSTLFPEVRLKHYLELRGPDSTAPEDVYAMAAFWSGIFYNETVLAQAWALVKDWGAIAHQAIRTEMPRAGLATKTPDGRDLFALAQEILPLAKQGLALQDQAFLKPFLEKVESTEQAARALSGT